MSGLQSGPASGEGPALVPSSSTFESSTGFWIVINTFDQITPATIWTLSCFRNFSTSFRPTSGFT